MKRRDSDQATGPSLKEFDLVEQLCFAAGWRPPVPGQPAPSRPGRWLDWLAFLNDWRQVRDEFLAKSGDCRPDGSPWYADRVTTFAQAHGLKALESASYERIYGELEPFEGETSTAYAARAARLSRDRD